MKKLFLQLVALIAMCNFSVAQIKFATGNAEMDANLNDINVNAKLDLGKFKADLSVAFSVPIKNIDHMLSINMEPAEAYLALEIASITHTPCDNVVEAYQKNKEKGWGVIAKEMGIKPGSAEFHELKNKTKGKKGKGAKKEGKGKGNGKGKGKNK